MAGHYHSSSSGGIRCDPVLSGLPPGSGVRPLWENDRVKNGPKRRNPAGGHGGVSEAFAATSCKVDGTGRTNAECKANLTEHPDVPQL